MAGIEELQKMEDESWEFYVQNNLTYLTQRIGNLPEILIHLIQHKVINDYDRQLILNEQHHPTDMDKNDKLLTTRRRKGWTRVKSAFAQILRETFNHNCADIIQFGEIQEATTSAKRSNPSDINSQQCPIKPAKRAKISHPPDHYSAKTLLNGVINSKWWPEELTLPTSFLERKIESELVTEKLKQMLTINERKMTLINQKVAVSGLGGIGKTTTAKSFAVKYAEDYELILWVDCGEGSLLKSFEKLARDLGLENRKELELKELACRSFEILKECKSLFIFDNAEYYVGKEGIRDVLPKNHDKFHVIITSRNREWGKKNIDGQISEFQLDAFGEDESLEFMKKNFETLKKNDEMKIKKICLLLGYLPLALQIAVATLNEHEIALDTYIKELQTKDDVLHSELDGYERTINKTLKITVELVEKHKRKNVGEMAIKILTIFGYITPDAVDGAFFMALNLGGKEEMNEATNLLQFYSIISKSKLEIMTFSIHRLFQQVIRHNTKEKQNQILRQIFSCDGFVEYKLIPFIYYADEELQKEFPKLKTKLIDKLQLKKLLQERRFEEAVELSRLINDSIQTPVSIFNFALCLKNNHEREEAKNILQELMNNTKRNGNINEIIFKNYKFSSIMDSDKELAFEVVAWELFLLYCEEKDEEAARQIFLSATKMTLYFCTFNSSFLSLLPQSLQKLTLNVCTISNCSPLTFGSIQLPPQLIELRLWENKFVDDDGRELKSFDISRLIPFNLNNVYISDSICASLDRLKLITSVDLSNCSLILVPGLHITPQQLILNSVEFFAADKEPIGNVLVNDFVDFRQMKKLNLYGSGMSIDLCGPRTLNSLCLSRTKVLDWKNANWTLHKMELFQVDFVNSTGMKVTEMDIYSSSVDISVLPSTIQKLKLVNCTLVNFSFSHHIKLTLPNLNKLYLKSIKINKEELEEKYANNDDLLRILVRNCDDWKLKKGKDFIGDYLDAHQKN